MSNYLFVLCGVFFMIHTISSAQMKGTLPADYTGTDSQKWKLFKETFHKKYASTLEEDKSKTIFLKNLKEAVEHNKLYVQKKVSYLVNIIQYEDIEYKDLKKKWKNLVPPKVPLKNQKKGMPRILPVSYGKVTPAFKDWRMEGKVTPVQNQGLCGACWAFSAVGAVESAYSIKYNRMLSLSEQELVECVPDKKEDGCSGGYLSEGYEYITESGIAPRSVYPYVGIDRRNCLKYPRSLAIKIEDYDYLPTGDEQAIKYRVAFDGPVSITMCTTKTFDVFGGDVFEITDCFLPSNPNVCTGIWHSMVIVGYGTTEQRKDYWLLKNSWGVEWGDNGYVKVLRGKNLCKIAEMPIYPILWRLI